jgi:hypothetical protein
MTEYTDLAAAALEIADVAELALASLEILESVNQ